MKARESEEKSDRLASLLEVAVNGALAVAQVLLERRAATLAERQDARTADYLERSWRLLECGYIEQIETEGLIVTASETLTGGEPEDEEGEG